MSKQIVKQELTFSRSTKSTHRFDAADEGAHVRSIYVDKAAFKGAEPPAKVTITIAGEGAEIEQGLVTI